MEGRFLERNKYKNVENGEEFFKPSNFLQGN